MPETIPKEVSVVEPIITTGNYSSNSAVTSHETMPTPTNVEALESLTSPASIKGRKQWLADQLSGEGDSAVGHVARLYGRAEAKMQQSWDAADAADRPESHRLSESAISLRETARRIFGVKTVKQFTHCRDAQDELKRGEMRFWGSEGKQVLDVLLAGAPPVSDGIDRAHTIPPTQRSEPTRQDYVDYLTQKTYVPMPRLHNRVDEQTPPVIVELEVGETYTIPISQIISAGTLDSWAGRGIDGQASKKYRTGEHKQDAAKSIDIIKEYAERETPLPPVEGINAYIQPDGKVLFKVPESNHRTAAAIARGQETVEVSREIVFRKLVENIA